MTLHDSWLGIRTMQMRNFIGIVLLIWAAIFCDRWQRGIRFFPLLDALNASKGGRFKAVPSCLSFLPRPKRSLVCAKMSLFLHPCKPSCYTSCPMFYTFGEAFFAFRAVATVMQMWQTVVDKNLDLSIMDNFSTGRCVFSLAYMKSNLKMCWNSHIAIPLYIPLWKREWVINKLWNHFYYLHML